MRAKRESRADRSEAEIVRAAKVAQRSLAKRKSIASSCLLIIACACTPLKETQPLEDSGPITGQQDACAKGATVGASCPVDAPSCKGLPETCGEGESCCATILLPEQKNFSRGYDASGFGQQDGRPVQGWQKAGAAPAHMLPFRLDRYEVTVGRFRKFVAGYDEWIVNNPIGAPIGRAGANSWVPGSEWRTDAWGPIVAKSEAELRTHFTKEECGGPPSFTPVAGDGENKPMNCLWWYDAFLFCIWDGGRLPTEAEWNVAAAGGEEQRAFPWSKPADDTIFHTRDAIVDRGTAMLGLENVGSIPDRNGRWGHRDMAGNVWEWVLDTCDKCTSDPTELATYAPGSCTHCATLGGDNRIIRGGSWKFAPEYARTAYRFALAPRGSFPDIGVRCARNVEAP
jgi:sulfatase modifying factor 1